MKAAYYLKLARPHQWVKNTLVFAAPVFANHLHIRYAAEWLKSFEAFCAFCCIASATYIVNDLIDCKSDILHPVKRHRPIASGKVGAAEAIIIALIFAIAGFLFAGGCGPLEMTLAAYVVLQIFYNAIFKNRMLADVICIAIGFVLRAIAGAVIISVTISPWLIICTFCLCLFLGFCKRYCEINTLGTDAAAPHRRTLLRYTPALLMHLITLSATLAIVTFLLYAMSDQTLAKFHTQAFIYTLPVIIYCICRAAMLSMNGGFAGPTELLLRDRGLIIGVLVWIAMIVLIILFPSKISFLN
ncbi:MAG TPA: decaprenyl-phosphate phosphoribosyltransferase [Phycisphaerae bacterium]|nr:decaprenyl-phosphate phosphoribosyltransferase [Phycisphaerae bacterium]HPS53735.1 decaprenyl-phosphate phosphoribosyltransferase [Phycisphaerae bacterium]